MELVDLANKLSGMGLAASLILIIIAGWREVWVFGSQLTRERALTEQMRTERDAWLRIALRTTGVAEQAVQHAATIQGIAP